jgi:ankyrin repeat protein
MNLAWMYASTIIIGVLCVNNNNTELVRLLLAAGAHFKPHVMPPVEDERFFDLDNRDMEIVDRAVFNGNIEIFTMLLEPGGRVG